MIRPSVQRQLSTWLEPMVAGCFLFFLGFFVVQSPGVSRVFLGLMLLLGVGLAIWLVNAIARARLRARSHGVGIVLVDEGRIGYFGPETGGFVDIDALSQVRVIGKMGGRSWELLHDDGAPMCISVDARDADQLVDFLARLEGVSPVRINKAVMSGETTTIWRR